MVLDAQADALALEDRDHLGAVGCEQAEAAGQQVGANAMSDAAGRTELLRGRAEAAGEAHDRKVVLLQQRPCDRQVLVARPRRAEVRRPEVDRLEAEAPREGEQLAEALLEGLERGVVLVRRPVAVHPVAGERVSGLAGDEARGEQRDDGQKRTSSVAWGEARDARTSSRA